MKFLETLPYVIQYIKGKKNMVANALSRKHVLFSTLLSKLIEFESLKTMYPEDHIFAQIFQDCEELGRERCMWYRTSIPFSKFYSFMVSYLREKLMSAL